MQLVAKDGTRADNTKNHHPYLNTPDFIERYRVKCGYPKDALFRNLRGEMIFGALEISEAYGLKTPYFNCPRCESVNSLTIEHINIMNIECEGCKANLNIHNAFLEARTYFFSMVKELDISARSEINKGSVNSPTVEQLIDLNPLLAKKEHSELELLIRELYNCSYKLDKENEAFVSLKFDKSIEVNSLHLFTDQSIRDWWGNDDFMEEYKSLKKLTNRTFRSIFLIFASIILLFLGYIKAGVILIILSVATILASESKKRRVLEQRHKREALGKAS